MINTNFVTKKITGGKLLRIDVSFDDTIEEITITGDFFLHPEGILTKLEDEIRGLYVPINKPGLIDRLNKIVERYNAELIGISVIDIVTTLGEALQ